MGLRDLHRAEPVLPETHRLTADVLTADVDTALEQQVLDLAQRQRTYIITVRRMISCALLK